MASLGGTTASPLHFLLLLLILPLSALAQFQFFEQMFNNPSQAQQHAQHHSPQQQNVASDSSWYRRNYDGAYCSNYLCPGTLACVHFPHHCPCAWPVQEDKFELGEEGSAICVSKKGWKEGELARRVELARKGWI